MFGAPPPPGLAPSSFTSLMPSTFRTKSVPQPSQPLKSFNWAKLGEVRQGGEEWKGGWSHRAVYFNCPCCAFSECDRWNHLVRHRRPESIPGPGPAGH